MIDETKMILAVDWKGEDLAGWLATEKLNGCRVEWDGKSFWTRHGNRVDAPEWFTRDLPNCRINGEIHAGRGTGTGNNNTVYKVAMTAVRHGGRWFNEPGLTFTALYLPDVDGSWERKQLAAKRAMRDCSHANSIAAHRCESPEWLADYLIKLRAVNAEGAMFVNPAGNGAPGRTGELLRIKF